MKKAAENGHMFAQFNLGEFYAAGNYVPKDTGAAVDWMIKSGEQGCMEAQIDLAEIYLYDEERRDPQLAFYWTQRASRSGDPESTTSLGRMYSLGQGVKQNAEKALEILLRRAEEGDEYAEF